jgi:GNAT superfamily N-acetyltransferase
LNANELAGFFADHPLLRAVIDAVLEDRGGRVLCLGARPTQAAMLDYGCYRIPGGDARSVQARDLLLDLRGPCEIVVPNDDAWRELIQDVHGDRLVDRSMHSYVPGPELAARTADLARKVPDGYVLQRLDAGSAALVGPDISPHGVEVMGGPAGFVQLGYGWGVLRDGGLACAATSYAVSSRAVEVAIATDPDHREQGLATCAAAALVQEALVREHVPHWNAFNPVSRRLAERLGFAFAGIVEIMALAPSGGVEHDPI